MKIPKKITIGAITWDVQFVDGLEMDCDSPPCGDSIPQKGVIRINKDMPLPQQELVFWHEILHACNNEMEHTEVEMLSILLHQISTQI